MFPYTQATASYLAPLVAPWWRSPRAKAQPLNAAWRFDGSTGLIEGVVIHGIHGAT